MFDLFTLILLIISSNCLSNSLSETTLFSNSFNNLYQGFIPQELVNKFNVLTNGDELLHLYIKNPSSYTYNFGPNILSNILIFEPKYNKTIQYDMLTYEYSQFKLNFQKEQSMEYPIYKCTLYYLTPSKLWNKILKENGRIIKVDKKSAYIEVNIFGTFCITCKASSFKLNIILYIIMIILILHN